jgi:hypothetical protein
MPKKAVFLSFFVFVGVAMALLSTNTDVFDWIWMQGWAKGLCYWPS